MREMLSDKICLMSAKADNNTKPPVLECQDVQAIIDGEAKRCPDCGPENLRLGNEEYSSAFIYCIACGYSLYLPGGPHV